jgi:predicted dehydrogenase
MVDPRPVRFGIVSPGRWGLKLLDAAQASSKLKLVAVSSRDAAKRETLAQERNCRAHPDLASVLADPEVEAVVLPTPHFLHHAQTLQALAAGRHVFVEKPLATTIEQGEEMARRAEETGLVVAVGHQGRHTGGMRRLKTMIEQGELGKIAAVVVVQGFPHALFRTGNDWRKSGTAVPGGQLDELGVHYFEVLQFLFGPVRRVTGFVQPTEAGAPPAAATVAMTFDGGVIANYTTYDNSVGSSRMVVYGSKGALELNRMGQDPCTWQPVANLATTRAGGLPAEPIKFDGPFLLSTALTAELEDFADAIRAKRPPQVGARESLATLRISRAVMEASATGCTIEFPR